MSRACFKSYAFRMRVKADTYNDETRLKHSVVDANELEWASYNKRLIQVWLIFFFCRRSLSKPTRYIGFRRKSKMVANPISQSQKDR